MLLSDMNKIAPINKSGIKSNSQEWIDGGDCREDFYER